MKPLTVFATLALAALLTGCLDTESPAPKPAADGSSRDPITGEPEDTFTHFAASPRYALQATAYGLFRIDAYTGRTWSLLPGDDHWRPIPERSTPSTPSIPSTSRQ